MVILIPPKNISSRINTLAQTATVSELELLTGKKKKATSFHWKAGAVVPFLSSKNSSKKQLKKVNDSTARAIVDLVNGRPIKKKS
jgi:hypothetical protein